LDILRFVKTNLMSKISVLIGIKIREIRKQSNINQESLALLADIDRSYMGRIERGEVNITVDKLYQLSSALNCSVHDLLPDDLEIKNT